MTVRPAVDRTEREATLVALARHDVARFDGFRAMLNRRHPTVGMDAALDIWIVAKTTRERTVT